LLAQSDSRRGDVLVTPRVMLIASLAAVLFFSVMLIVLFRDVRRRERTERELRMAQQRLLSLTSSLEDMVFALDREGRLTEIYGRLDIDASELIGKTPRDLFGDDAVVRSEEHTSELQSRENLVC